MYKTYLKVGSNLRKYMCLLTPKIEMNIPTIFANRFYFTLWPPGEKKPNPDRKKKKCRQHRQLVEPVKLG